MCLWLLRRLVSVLLVSILLQLLQHWPVPVGDGRGWLLRAHLRVWLLLPALVGLLRQLLRSLGL